MESNTPYANQLADNISPETPFHSVYDFSIKHLPENATFADIMKSLNNGIAIIDDYDTLAAYIAMYGLHHYHKLQISFEALLSSIPDNATIDILDYGCGQALASFILIDFLHRKGKSVNINAITLIEPSSYALSRGKLHLHHLNKVIDKHHDVEIYKVQKSLDHLIKQDISTRRTTLKIHLFSNILDVDGINLTELYTTITDSQKGDNLFVCVSPYNSSQARLAEFYELFPTENKQKFEVSQYPIERLMYDVEHKEERTRRITMVQCVFSCQL